MGFLSSSCEASTSAIPLPSLFSSPPYSGSGTFADRATNLAPTNFSSSEPTAINVNKSLTPRAITLLPDPRIDPDEPAVPKNSPIRRDRPQNQAGSSASVSSELKGVLKLRNSHPDKESWQYVLTSGLAGGIAGCIAKTSVAPLDRVKILFQTRNPEYARYAGTWTGVFKASQDIYAETGIRGLLQGHSATLLRIFPYAAIKFMAYEKFHVLLMPTQERETSARRFVAGSMAGVTSAILTYPLELIRVRLAFESHHAITDRSSLLRTIRQIYAAPPIPLYRPKLSTTTSSQLPTSAAASSQVSQASSASQLASANQNVKPSITHFYRGIFPTLFGIIPYAGTSFLIWGFLKNDLMPKYLSPTFRNNNKASLDLIAGGLAGAIGQTAAYPLDIVRRRMQVSPVVTSAVSGGFWVTAKTVYTTSGWRGFFVGLSIGYLKVVPMNAVSFAAWMFLKNAMGLESGHQG